MHWDLLPFSLTCFFLLVAGALGVADNSSFFSFLRLLLWFLSSNVLGIWFFLQCCLVSEFWFVEAEAAEALVAPSAIPSYQLLADVVIDQGVASMCFSSSVGSRRVYLLDRSRLTRNVSKLPFQ